MLILKDSEKGGAKVLELVKEFIKKLIDELNKGIVIESEIMVGSNKLEYALSTEDFMASISVLSDLTYDFYALEIESEETLMMRTKEYESLEKMFLGIQEDILNFACLTKS